MLEKFTAFWTAHKGKVKLVVAFVLGGAAAIGYVVPEPIVHLINSLVQ